MPVPTEKIENIAFCPHCTNTAPQRLVFLHLYEGVSYEVSSGKKSKDGLPCTYYVAVCSTCNDLLLYHCSFLDGVEHQRFSAATLIYPSAQDLQTSVPETVRQAYTEASRIRSTAPNAYAVMLRRALEAVCDDRGVSEGSLQKRLEVLAQRGELPTILSEMTSMLRTLGNAGAHHSSMPITVPMTWGMEEFFRAVIEYVYIAPSKIQEFKKRLQPPSLGKA